MTLNSEKGIPQQLIKTAAYLFAKGDINKAVLCLIVALEEQHKKVNAITVLAEGLRHGIDIEFEQVQDAFIYLIKAQMIYHE